MWNTNTRLLVARIFVLCSVAVFVSKADSKTSSLPVFKRIVNGTPIPISEAPYIVQITDYYGVWACAGTLVSPQFIVSAAHCFDNYPKSELRVMAGVEKLYWNFDKVKHRIENYWIHPKFEFDTDEHMDVAVLKLVEPLEIRDDNKNIQPIAMCNKPFKKDQTVRIVGWGRTSFETIMGSNDLQYIDVPVFSKEECIQLHKGTDTNITDSMMCAGIPGYQDACGGDSGGPVVRRNKLCGIVSWGVGCASKQYPGVYTSIPAVRDFIDECMKL